MAKNDTTSCLVVTLIVFIFLIVIVILGRYS
jgi:hypothetical protein